MKKTSQLYGQIFIYALTLILISVVLIYGYSAIKNFRQKTDDIVAIKLEKDLKNSIQSITNDYGSVSKKEFQLSGDITQACFADFEIADKSSPVSSVSLNKLVINSIRDSDKNVFLLGDGLKSSFFAGRISVDNDVLCIRTTGNRITLRMEGKGDYAYLSRWE
ncbi:hypothetical protein HY637_03190 [Candidatus Woesearchaeota archaeon]|nr:hypothetical protein [Candidatus Woesearchaeota archaeon]